MESYSMYSFLSGFFFFSFSIIESHSCCCCCCWVAPVVSDSVRPHSVYQYWSLFLTAEPTVWICRSYFIPSPLDGYLVVLSFSSVQSLSRVRLFATLWIAVHPASLSITNSRSSLKLTSIESEMPSSHLILCCPFLLLPPIPPSIRVLDCYKVAIMYKCLYGHVLSFLLDKFLK